MAAGGKEKTDSAHKLRSLELHKSHRVEGRHEMPLGHCFWITLSP